MRCDPHSQLQWNLLLQGFFEREVNAFIRSALKPGEVFFDIGANVGCYTLQAAGLVGPQGRVFSFEPDPQVFEILQANIGLNSLAQVHALNLALGNRAGTLPFYRAAAGPFANALGSVHRSSWHDGGGAVNVKMDQLDDVAPEFGLTRLDLIKMDVEGAEYEVIAGAERTLAAHRPRIVMEINLHAAEASGWKPIQMVSRLRGWRYRIQCLDEAGSLQTLPADLDNSSFTLVAEPE
jgi:FkbM family methyltransferase